MNKINSVLKKINIILILLIVTFFIINYILKIKVINYMLEVNSLNEDVVWINAIKKTIQKVVEKNSNKMKNEIGGLKIDIATQMILYLILIVWLLK